MDEKLRRGRPPRSEEPEHEYRVDVRMSPALRRAVRLAALEADVSMGEWLRRAAQEKLEREHA